MTLEQALPIVHEWLGTWRAGEMCGEGKDLRVQCNHQSIHSRPKLNPMPPANDAMLAQILRRLRDHESWRVNDETGQKFLMSDPQYPELWYDDGFWNCRINSWEETYRHPNDPVIAAILACAEWLLPRKQK